MRALALLLVLAACAPAVRTAYPGQHVASAGPSPLSRAPRALVEVRGFAEVVDVPAGVVGEIRGANGRVVQTLSIAPPPGVRLRDAVVAELAAAGHLMVGPGAAAVVEGGVQRFAFEAYPDKLTWDSKLRAQVAVTVSFRGQRVSRAYTAECTDAGVLRPTSDSAGDIAAACIDNIARQFRNDEAVARLLSGS